MGRAARPLHDPGNHGSIERGSNLQAACRGSLKTPAKPAGERENHDALTPRPGTRSMDAAVGDANTATHCLKNSGLSAWAQGAGRVAKGRLAFLRWNF